MTTKSGTPKALSAFGSFVNDLYYGWSQTAFGIIIGINSIAVMSGSFVALRFHPLKKGLSVAAWVAFAACLAQLLCLFFFDSFWIFEILWFPILLSLGVVFNAANTIAMNEGRAHAGNASALVGLAGYACGAIVSPLVGKGDILHSTGLTIMVLATLMLAISFMSRSLPVDLQE